MKDIKQTETHEEAATFGSGCFWCSEAAFSQLPGVISATPGYMGGTKPAPSYQEVCSGETGHAEVVQVRYNPSLISYGELLAFFFKLHDPTQLNRQGEDIGTQYRSVIFYHTEKQAIEAREAITREASFWNAPVVTELKPAENFYPAENYHRDYYRLNKDKNPYCQLVIKPKLGKLGLEH